MHDYDAVLRDGRLAPLGQRWSATPTSTARARASPGRHGRLLPLSVDGLILAVSLMLLLKTLPSRLSGQRLRAFAGLLVVLRLVRVLR
jgi:hypothetical protein